MGHLGLGSAGWPTRVLDEIPTDPFISSWFNQKEFDNGEIVSSCQLCFQVWFLKRFLVKPKRGIRISCFWAQGDPVVTWKPGAAVMAPASLDLSLDEAWNLLDWRRWRCCVSHMVFYVVASNFSLFSPLFGEDEPILTYIFHMGWNHQVFFFGAKLPRWSKTPRAKAREVAREREAPYPSWMCKVLLCRVFLVVKMMYLTFVSKAVYIFSSILYSDPCGDRE